MMLVEDLNEFSLKCGGFAEYYNPRVFTLNGVEDTRYARNAVLSAHKKRHRLCDEMFELVPDVPGDLVKLRECAARMEEIEFELQKAWGFTPSREFHTYWYQVPHCTCPKLDNKDNVGTSLRIIGDDCPIHSK